MEKNDKRKLVWCFGKCTCLRPGKRLVLVLSHISCGTSSKPLASLRLCSQPLRWSERWKAGACATRDIVSSLWRNWIQSIPFWKISFLLVRSHNVTWRESFNFILQINYNRNTVSILFYGGHCFIQNKEK